MFHPRTILHPTDFSYNSQHALRLAADLAGAYDAELIILHVYAAPVALYGEGMLPPPAPEDHRAQLDEELHRIEVPHARTSYRLVEGNAVGEILRLAQDEHADLIVMGTHGRRGLSRMLMGSVAELVVRRSACPVLTVHTPAAAEPVEAGEPASAAAH
jgi:universal stress protein A